MQATIYGLSPLLAHLVDVDKFTEIKPRCLFPKLFSIALVKPHYYRLRMKKKHRHHFNFSYANIKHAYVVFIDQFCRLFCVWLAVFSTLHFPEKKG